MDDEHRRAGGSVRPPRAPLNGRARKRFIRVDRTFAGVNEEHTACPAARARAIAWRAVSTLCPVASMPTAPLGTSRWRRAIRAPRPGRGPPYSAPA
jgi:hypothetical protein